MKICLNKLLVLFLFVSLLSPLMVQGVEIPNPLKANNFWELIGYLIDFIFYLAIVISPIMIIIAGFYFITAMGEPEKINAAKKIILWTLIGLLVVICAKGIVNLFGEIFDIDVNFSE